MEILLVIKLNQEYFVAVKYNKKVRNSFVNLFLSEFSFLIMFYNKLLLKKTVFNWSIKKNIRIIIINYLTNSF